jgi:hypothetical protein
MNRSYTPAEINEANQSALLASEARTAIKSCEQLFINLPEPGKYVNTLDERSAYIRVSRCYRHRVGNHEEMGITVSLSSPLGNSSVFVPAPQVWARCWVYGGKCIERRYHSVLPAKEAIDRAIDQMRREYDDMLAGSSL